MAAVSLALAVLPACQTTGGLAMSAAPVEVAREKALAFPPPAGPAIVSVVERTYSNAIQQDILLETNSAIPGENYFKVQFYGPSPSGLAGAERLSLIGFNTGAIARDLRLLFPGMRMAITGTYQQNGYGPFAYAFGTDEHRGESCLYAWQEIRSSEHARNGINDLGMIRTRLRLCERDSSLASLLSVMHHYTLTGGFADPRWNPYGPLPEPDARVGQAGKPIYSLPVEEVAAVQTVAPVAAPRRASRGKDARAVNNPVPAAVARRPLVEVVAPVAGRSGVEPSVIVPPPSLPLPADAAAEASTVGISDSRPAPMPASAPMAAPVIPAPPSLPSAPCVAKTGGCGAP